MASGDEEKVVRQLVQNLRSDLSLLSNEAKKKYPAVKEVCLPSDPTTAFFFLNRESCSDTFYYIRQQNEAQ